MAVNLITAKTGLFNRLGAVFGIISRVETFQSDLVDASGTSFQEAINEYINTVGATSNTDLGFASALIDNLDEMRNACGTPALTRCFSAAIKTLIEMVDADNELPHKGVQEALIELRDQMISSSDSLDASTIAIGSVTAKGGNTGTGTVIVSAEPNNTTDSTLSHIPTARTEILTFKCIQDAKDKSIPLGAERFSCFGERSFPALDHRWPGGSGRIGTYPCCSPTLSDGRRQGRNILRNSDFENFTSNTPFAWEIATGSAGTHVYEDTSIYARGSSALKMASDGSTNIRVHQKLGDISVGSPIGIKSDALYAIAMLIRYSGTGPSAGALRVGLAASDGTVSSASYLSVAHGALTTSFVLHSTSFRARLDLVDPPYFAIKQSTAFTSGTNLHIDGLVMAEMIPTAPGGVHFLVIPGATDWATKDELTVQVTNDGAGAFQKYMDRVFGLYRSGIFCPGHPVGSETVADSLIA